MLTKQYNRLIAVKKYMAGLVPVCINTLQPEEQVPSNS